MERAVRRRQGGKVTRPPRVAHERQIALSKTGAYYEALNKNATFAPALVALFNEWSLNNDRWATLLARFVARWPLPPEATKDLVWSHGLWERGQIRSPRLVASARSFPPMPGSGPLAFESGYRVRPPRSMNRSDLERGAHLLVERVVNGRSWYALGGDDKPTAYPRDTRAIRRQVARYAMELDIALPKNNIGRPQTPGSGAPEESS